MKRCWGAIAGGLVTLSGCVPLTFSHDPAIDFEVYRRVAVEVLVAGASGVAADASATSYLAGELDNGSGFELVTINPSVEVDLTLTVQVRVNEVVTVYDDTVDYEYHAVADFRAVDTEGGVVDSGTVDDTSEFAGEALEDALDEVALHYLRPYRL